MRILATLATLGATRSLIIHEAALAIQDAIGSIGSLVEEVEDAVDRCGGLIRHETRNNRSE